MTTGDLTRPIVGIENRTAVEVFDIMCDRFRRAHARAAGEAEPVAWRYRWHFDGHPAPTDWLFTDTAPAPRDHLEAEPLYTHLAPAQEPVAVPAGGWKLVPVEMTAEMARRAVDAGVAAGSRGEKWAPAAWTAALAAAPVSPPADGGEEREKLSEIIKTRLLGVLANEQDVVLEDADWRVILSALEAPPQAQDFAKGAEAMREVCIMKAHQLQKVHGMYGMDCDAIEIGEFVDELRALPLPTPAGEG